MQKIFDYLQQLGFSEIESKLYLALLESGPMSVRDLAELTNIKRTTAYFHIDLLVDKGLIIRVVNGSRKQIAAAQPESGLQALVEKQMQSAHTVEKEFPEVLQTISTSFPGFKDDDTFEIKHYKSISGIHKIYEDLFRTDDLCSYIKLVGSGSFFSDNIALLDDAFVKNPKLKIRELIDDSPLSRSETGENLKRHPGRYFRKFLPKEMELTAEDVHIYDGKVAIIHFIGKINAVVLRDADYYNNAKALFEYLWRTLPETK
jgi:predicted transcriptional regulator